MTNQGGAARTRSRIPDALDALLLLGAPAVLLAPAIGPGRTVFGIDFALVFYFTHAWVTSQLRAGRLPVWDPHTMCGFPLLAAVQAAVFYPPTWLELILPPAWFWSFVTWLHLALAGLFANAWLRRGLGCVRPAALCGALVFALSGYLVTHLYAGHVNYVWAYPWGAFALWRLERWLAGPTPLRGALLALPLPLMILAGVPQLSFATGLLLGARCALFVLHAAAGLRERLRVAACTAAVLAFGMLLAAPQLLPTIELIGHTQRVAVNGADFVTSFSLPPENLATLVAPTIFGDAVRHAYWGRWTLWDVCGYVGVATLFLSLLGACSRRGQAWFWASAAVLSVGIALGGSTPLFGLFHAIVPGAGFFRGPGRYLYVFVIATTALTGLGGQSILAADARSARRSVGVGAAALGVAAVLLLAAAVVHAIGSASPSWHALFEAVERARSAVRQLSGGVPLPITQPAFLAASHAAMRHALVAAAGWSAACGVVLVAAGRGWVPPRIASSALAVLVVADLVGFDRAYVRPVELDRLGFSPRTAAVIERRVGMDFRLTSAGDAGIADPGRAQIAGLAHTSGYEPMLLGRYADLFNAIDGQPLSTPMVGAMLGRPDAIAAMLGARGWLAPAGAADDPQLRLVWTLEDGRQLREWRAALPRAFLVPRSIVRPDLRDRLEALTAPGWDPRAVVVLEDGDLREESFGAASELGTAAVVARAPGEYVVDADTPAGAFLVLAESWFPGWQVEVDGTVAPLLRANHLFQAVRLEPGRHRVRFAYRSRSLAIGLATAASAVALAGVLAAIRSRRRRPRAAADRAAAAAS